MELSISDKSSKRRRSSFWMNLPGLNRKSKADRKSSREDVTLISANKIYGSFRPQKAELETTSVWPWPDKDYITFEDMNLSQLRREHERMIQKVTKSSRETNESRDAKHKHVQFAPTPLNKYHVYDNARTPCKGNKENITPTSNEERSFRTQKSLMRRGNGSLKDVRNCIANETRQNTLPRTSTKSALSDGKDMMSLHNFDVSEIRPSTLARNQTSRNLSCDFIDKEKSILPEDHRALSQQNLPSLEGILSLDDLSIPPKPFSNGNVADPFEYDASGIAFLDTWNSVSSLRNVKRNQARDSINGENDWQRISNHDNKIGNMQGKKTVSPSYVENGHQLPNSLELRTCSQPKVSDNRIGNHSQGNLTRRPNTVLYTDCATGGTETWKLENDLQNPSLFTEGRNQSGARYKRRQSSCTIPPFVPHPMGCNYTCVNTLGDGGVLGCTETGTRNGNEISTSFPCRNVAQSVKFLPKVGLIDANLAKIFQGRNCRMSMRVPLTSSPNHLKTRSSSFRMKRYDGVSSLADDECSLNCSCLNCTKNFGHLTEKGLQRRKSFKEQLFFPFDKRDQNKISGSVPGAGDTRLPSSSKNQWFECNDSMCRSPAIQCTLAENELDHTVREEAVQTVSLNTGPHSTDFHSDCFAAKEISSRERGTLGKASNSSSRSMLQDDCCAKDDNVATELASGIESEKNKLGDSCISVLQETLKNLLLTTQNQSSFTISGFKSSPSGNNSNTIVIHIQNKGQQSTDNSKLSGVEGTEDSQAEVHVKSEENLKGSSKRGQNIRPSSSSLPDLANADGGSSKSTTGGKKFISTSAASLPSLKEANDPRAKRKAIYIPDSGTMGTELSRCSPDGWERTPSINGTSAGSGSDMSKHVTESNCSLSEMTAKETEEEKTGRGAPEKRNPAPSFNISSPKKFKAKEVLSGKAKLKLSIYHNSGMVTVHVVKAVKLTSVRTLSLNPYVKVSLHPDGSRKAHWRTSVVKNENNPVFDQKFSFEISSEDYKKRLIFSVWHRDLEKKRSEFLGCMSFGMHHVMEASQSLNGWYRLLKEVIGTRKHFAARTGCSLSKLMSNSQKFSDSKLK